MTEDIRVQFTRGNTAQNDAYTGRDGELTIDTEKKQLRIHDGFRAGGLTTGQESVTISVNSWAASDFVAPLGVTVTKANAGTSISITHNKDRYPTGWFAFNKGTSPMVGIQPTPTRNLHVVDANTVIVTDVSSFGKFDLSINFG